MNRGRGRNPTLISGIIHMLKCGGRWADYPSEYGPATKVNRTEIAGGQASVEQPSSDGGDSQNSDQDQLQAR